jgi:hypothetical protein
VRPGSGTKVSVQLVLPQNRHPERSAALIYRVIQHSGARSRRTPAVPIQPILFGAFNHRARTGTVFPGSDGPTKSCALIQRITEANLDKCYEQANL